MLWINYILIKKCHGWSKEKLMGLEKGYDSASLWAFLLSSVFTCQMALFQVSELSCALSLQEICKYSGCLLINKRSVIPKKGNARECSNYWTTALISHVSKIMLKILQARLQQYMNCELPNVQAGFRKGRGTRDQLANIQWIIKKARDFQKIIYFCFIDYTKAFDCVDHNKLWKILKEMGIPDHLTCLLRNLYAGQEATDRNGHGTMDWFQTGQGYFKAVYCYPAYLTYMQSTSLQMLG